MASLVLTDSSLLTDSSQLTADSFEKLTDQIIKSWHGSYEAQPWAISSPKTAFKPGGRNTRRIAVLNKVFMRHITDIMATGEDSKEIAGRGIEVSRVKVSADFSHLSVYWLAQNSSEDNEIESILKCLAGKLRHELSQLQIIGMVPKVDFVKDKQYALMADVDELLLKADFGEDYVPVHPHYHNNATFTQIEKFTPGFVIQTRMKKTRAVHRSEPAHLYQDTPVDESMETPEYLSAKQRHDNFAKFLKYRQLSIEKTAKSTKNYRPELDLYEDEILESSKFFDEFADEFDEKDYINESEENY
uniref:Ribosome-binding factor A n=1 Tax=Timema shepardi TaxID=629360 RepID=A0A7R9ASI9_TIMSH|nr:unnamed protein product [Timema shepardi]